MEGRQHGRPIFAPPSRLVVLQTCLHRSPPPWIAVHAEKSPQACPAHARQQDHRHLCFHQRPGCHPRREVAVSLPIHIHTRRRPCHCPLPVAHCCPRHLQPHDLPDRHFKAVEDKLRRLRHHLRQRNCRRPGRCACEARRCRAAAPASCCAGWIPPSRRGRRAGPSGSVRGEGLRENGTSHLRRGAPSTRGAPPETGWTFDPAASGAWRKM